MLCIHPHTRHELRRYCFGTGVFALGSCTVLQIWGIFGERLRAFRVRRISVLAVVQKRQISSKSKSEMSGRIEWKGCNVPSLYLQYFVHGQATPERQPTLRFRPLALWQQAKSAHSPG